jgi:hypothetical protein
MSTECEVRRYRADDTHETLKRRPFSALSRRKMTLNRNFTA